MQSHSTEQIYKILNKEIENNPDYQIITLHNGSELINRENFAQDMIEYGPATQQLVTKIQNLDDTDYIKK